MFERKIQIRVIQLPLCLSKEVYFLRFLVQNDENLQHFGRFVYLPIERVFRKERSRGRCTCRHSRVLFNIFLLRNISSTFTSLYLTHFIHFYPLRPRCSTLSLYHFQYKAKHKSNVRNYKREVEHFSVSFPLFIYVNDFIISYD